EARMMAALRHPGVVEVYDYGDATDSNGGVAYLVMGYVDGQPLTARIAEAGRLSVEETMSVVAQAARALHAAHSAGIVHRDVKPANLLVRPDGKVVLVDFGVARSATVTSVTALHEVVGTALYMAPEQVRRQALTPATDVYALGATAYHCLAGRPPFGGDSLVEVALRHLDTQPPPLPPDVPEPVQAMVRRALAKDPADRYPDAAAFAEAARRAGTPVVNLAAGPADLAGPAGAGPAQPVPPAARRRLARHLPAAVAVLLGVAVLAVLLQSKGSEPVVPGPGRDRPSTGPAASAGAGPAPGGRPVASPGPRATGSPPAGSPRPSGQVPGGDGPPQPSTNVPTADVSTPDPNSVPTDVPTDDPADRP
ncbi:MAG TPA: protein kinase, partial [Micromonosporaceae bacterium]|nr:protein kinase [Micromonosporaceae bacterium]